jgi:uncharacterized lipoprotein YddW (UPF0748 family)
MKNKDQVTRLSAILLAALLPLGCATQQAAMPDSAALVPGTARALDMPPPAPREFRAACVAILDKLVALNMNAVVLQVRPSADAIYPSALEPWTEYLTGTQGKPPEPYYDPLKMWIDEAHARGLELHAWINPYRAKQNGAKSPTAASHIINSHPNSVRSYGNMMWMDPADAWAAQRTLDVVADIVKRYDVDGMHLDDYFYPYPIEVPKDPNAVKQGDAVAAALNGNGGKPEMVEVDFPDEPTWQAYLAGGGKLARPDWRRQNVNQLIEKMYRKVHDTKSWVRFGISPFGIPKPGQRPEGICCFSQFDKLYADAELWFNNGWVDYFAPQLYWAIDQKAQSFAALVPYWAGQNKQGRNLYPGLFTSRIDKTWQPPEILNQIALARGQTGGHIHFSMAALMQNRAGIADQLRAGLYAQPALVPATTWLGGEAPGVPAAKLAKAGGATRVTLQAGAGKAPAVYAVWARYGNQWRFSTAPAARGALDLGDDPALGAPDKVVVSAVSSLGLESPRVTAQ